MANVWDIIKKKPLEDYNWKYTGDTGGQPGVGAIGGAPTYEAWKEQTGGTLAEWMDATKAYYGGFANKGGGVAGAGVGSQNTFMDQYMDEMRRQRELQEAEARRRREMYNRLTGILDSYELSDEEKMRVASKREELRGRVVEDYKRQFAQSLEARTREQEAEAASRGISGGLARKGEQKLKGQHLGQVASMRAQMPLQVADDVRAFEQDYRQMLNDKSKTALGMFGSAGEGALGYAKNIGAGLSDLSSLYQDESQFNRERADTQNYWNQQLQQWDRARKDSKDTSFWGGLASGATVGSAFGPWGTALGGLAGGLYGLLD